MCNCMLILKTYTNVKLNTIQYISCFYILKLCILIVYNATGFTRNWTDLCEVTIENDTICGIFFHLVIKEYYSLYIIANIVQHHAKGL